ncbi:MAG: DNA-binding transcriptional regulator [Bacteroidales bacterium]|nr:DNA-binding transcriptional regulator [Bacteroidales bacterium]
MRLLFITDFTEQFAYRFLRGILDYSQRTEPWVVCKMPPAFKRHLGIEGVVSWAKTWKADVVIAQFDPEDDVTIFRKNGIIAIAQDYVSKFKQIPNITGEYDKTGRMAAEHFLNKRFENFGFFGYNGVCWSDERYEGFRKALEEAGYGENVHLYDRQNIDNMWYYDQSCLHEWLISLPKPIAIMACDDNQGNLLIQACHVCGFKIPFDVAIIGVDNDEILCNMSEPAMSTINVDIERGGYDTAEMVDRMVADPSYKGEDITLQSLKVIPRVSSSLFATNDPAVLKALRFILANVDKRISVSDVLNQVPMSRRLLEQRFKSMTGVTIYNYIMIHRIERFAQLLLSSNDSVSDIAARLDEFDTKSISRRFKALKGCTPMEYRKKKLRKM